jgi:hypothetical protein
MRGGGSPSFEKFNYLLRPSKQVERKLFIEALHKLSTESFRIPEYTYLGFGSVYYADFILFHKYLYIDKMICVESASIPNRMRFNIPFEFIQLHMKQVAQVIPQLNRDEKYIVWLDYEKHLDRDILADTAGLLHVLVPGSVLIVTVDADPRLLNEREADEECRERQIQNLLTTFRDELGRYYPGEIRRSVISRSGLPKFFAGILRSQFQEELAKRPGIEFLQLFNFKYADGAQMLSLGGVVGDAEDGRRLMNSGVFELQFVTKGDEPIRISVPPLTVREKQWLEQKLKDSLRTEDLAFELDQDLLDNFRAYYRHYPSYHETLV